MFRENQGMGSYQGQHKERHHVGGLYGVCGNGSHLPCCNQVASNDAAAITASTCTSRMHLSHHKVVHEVLIRRWLRLWLCRQQTAGIKVTVHQAAGLASRGVFAGNLTIQLSCLDQHYSTQSVRKASAASDLRPAHVVRASAVVDI